MSNKRVMVEVEEGSRAWAVAMQDQGGELSHDTWLGAKAAHSPACYLGPEYDTGWRLYVEPPQPITLYPGTDEYDMVVAHRKANG